MTQQPQNDHPLYRKQDPNPQDTDAPQAEEVRQQGIPIPLAAKMPVVTYALIVINVTIFALRYFVPEFATQIILAGFIDPDAVIQDGQFYRLFTGMFLHFNESHMMFNGIALYYIGSNIERLFGHVRFGLIYLLGGLAGSIFPLLFGGGGLGASGAVFAIWGAEVVFLYRNLRLLGEAGKARIRSTGMLMLFNFAFGFTANAISNVADTGVRIGNAAHFGGLLGGAILAWFIAPIFVVKRTTPTESSPHGIVIGVQNALASHGREILGFVVGLVVLLAVAGALRL